MGNGKGFDRGFTPPRLHFLIAGKHTLMVTTFSSSKSSPRFHLGLSVNSQLRKLDYESVTLLDITDLVNQQRASIAAVLAKTFCLSPGRSQLSLGSMDRHIAAP
jgi:hypothetical protein